MSNVVKYSASPRVATEAIGCRYELLFVRDLREGRPAGRRRLGSGIRADPDRGFVADGRSRGIESRRFKLRIDRCGRRMLLQFEAFRLYGELCCRRKANTLLADGRILFCDGFVMMLRCRRNMARSFGLRLGAMMIARASRDRRNTQREHGQNAKRKSLKFFGRSFH